MIKTKKYELKALKQFSKELVSNNNEFLNLIISNYDNIEIKYDENTDEYYLIITSDKESTKVSASKLDFKSFKLPKYKYQIRKKYNSNNKLEVYNYNTETEKVNFNITSRESRGIISYTGDINLDNKKIDNIESIAKDYSYLTLSRVNPGTNFMKERIEVISHIIGNFRKQIIPDNIEKFKLNNNECLYNNTVLEEEINTYGDKSTKVLFKSYVNGDYRDCNVFYRK